MGYPHPSHLLRELTSQQVTDWMAFYKHRPFGFVRASQLFGTLAAQQHNMNKTRGRSMGWKDFFPVEVRRVDDDGRDDSEKIISLFKAYNAERGFK